MTRFWLVRHGQTDWNIQGRWQGQSPLAPPLNETGQAQARALADELAGKAFDAIYSSDLPRARQTAETIAHRLGLSIVFDPRLREVGLGMWEGMLGEDVERDFPDAYTERRHNPVHHRPPEGETIAEVTGRMRAMLSDITSIYPVGSVIVVTHGLAMATALCLSQSLPLEGVFEHLPHNAHPMIVDWPSTPTRPPPLDFAQA